jgi:uncharacterized protein with HEPN domain
MSKKSDAAKLENIKKYITDIAKIIKNHGDIQKTLSDTEGQYAIFMCLTQIGEILSRIENEKYREVLSVREVRDFRNIIVHDYDTLDLMIVEKILLEDLPGLEITVNKLLKDEKR